jgi:hypothetical protein
MVCFLYLLLYSLLTQYIDSRNDLNLISEKDTVYVPSLMKVESFATVHQLVSTITGMLRKDLTAIDAMMHSFHPGKLSFDSSLRKLSQDKKGQ